MTTVEKIVSVVVAAGALTVGYAVIPEPDEKPTPVVEVSPVVEAVVEAEQYIAMALDTAGGPIGVEVRVQPSLLDKSDEALALLGYAVPKRCGTVAERGTLCPEAYPPTKRCACCGGKPGTDCEGGSLCRYASGDDGKECDPDAQDCVPWPCWVYAGDKPEDVASQ